MVTLLQIKYCKTITVDGGKEKCGITNGKEFSTISQIKAWYNEKLPLDEFIIRINGLIEAQEYQ